MRVHHYRVQNHRSFRDLVELSFVSTAQPDEPRHRTGSAFAQHGVLPAVGVWGANAAGKSGLLNAIVSFKRLVQGSFLLRPDEPVPWQPFALDVQGPPTRHEIEFELSGVLHRYGFEHTDVAFTQEWLYSQPGTRWQKVFHRGLGEATPWSFGRSFLGPRSTLVEQTRPNALLLSTAAQLNHEQLGAVYRAITTGIRGASRVEFHGFPVFGSGAPILQDAHRSRFAHLLQAIDVGCSGFEIEALRAELPTEVLDMLRPEVAEKVRAAEARDAFHLKLLRGDAGGRTWTLPPELESAGTNVALRRLNDIVAQRDGLLVMDELDVSLHPALAEAVLTLFTSAEANPSGRQLLFSAHNRQLMEGLRRDEIVIVEKDPEGTSRIHAVSDFRGIRRERTQLHDLYAAGQLGGMPLLGPLGRYINPEASDG